MLDEASFLAESDIETARALLPGLATTGGMLVTVSSPYRRSGLVYELHRDFFGVDSDDCLVVAGPSIVFNPTLDVAMIEAATAADPEAAASEWHGEFRVGLSQLFDDATLDQAIDRARPLELPPVSGIFYEGFVDASSGTGHDAFTVGVVHKDKDGLYVVDLVRGTVGPFDPQAVTGQYAALLKDYGIATIVGDYFAAGWVASAFADHGIKYIRAELPKSQIYLECVSLFTRGLVRLPDHPKLLRELRMLERHTHRFGKDSVIYTAATEVTILQMQFAARFGR